MDTLEGSDRTVTTPHVGPGLVVLLVTPDEIVRRGLASMLHGVHGVGSVRACTDVTEAVACVSGGRFDLLVVDASLVSDVLSMSDELDRRGTKTMLLLGECDEDTVRLVADIDFDGFVSTDGLTQRGLAAALARVQQGEVTLPAEFARRMMAAASSREWAGGLVSVLTSRERQTLQLLGQGLSNKEIANSLGISGHGAKRNVANVLAKLNCTNRTLAVAKALRTGLLDESDATCGIL